jgi:plastocyanin
MRTTVPAFAHRGLAFLHRGRARSHIPRRCILAARSFLIPALALVGCGGGSSEEATSPTPSGPRTVTVDMVSSGGGYGNPVTYQFAARTVTVSVGDTVLWRNTTAAVHTVTADDGSFDSGDVGAQRTYRRAFDRAGTYRYYCRYHGAPGGVGMAGTVQVAP